jgi:hypothetical protein
MCIKQWLASTITKYQATGMIKDRKHLGRPKTVTPACTHMYLNYGLDDKLIELKVKLLEKVTAQLRAV